MAAKDAFHNAVKTALQKDEWLITHDPLTLDFGDVQFFIDLGAERLIAAERAGEKIAVEIKSFLAPSLISEFHTALGQFINYRFALSIEEPNRTLYLAVPIATYEDFFVRRFTQLIIQEYQLKLLVFDPVNEVVVQWQK